VQRLLMFLSIAVAGCTPAVPPTHSAPPAELAGRVAGQNRSCISLGATDTLVPLDESSLAYRSGNTMWVARLRAPCRGLDPTNTIIVERSGAQACRGDHVRVIERPLTTPGRICVLGDFIPYRRAR
jgi:hypothetical protein